LTDKVRLGTSVYILPLRNPFVTARAVVTLDRLSQGRAILGVGIGWRWVGAGLPVFGLMLVLPCVPEARGPLGGRRPTPSLEVPLWGPTRACAGTPLGESSSLLLFLFP
ncbi:MAG: LLM class flavin-dependent oxidoreductase, partial [Gemmatimonadetes bacterium]|nr:LLM class flavin-dependent oxidoreductase [Gemmatimonadota bacterium]